MQEGAKESKRRLPAPLEYHAADGKKAAYAVIRDPSVGIGRGWKIDFGGANAGPHDHHGHEH
jgi:alpha 1,3-glucosidase